MQRRKSMRLGLNEPTRRRNAHWATQSVVVEEGVAAEVVAVVAVGEQTGALGEVEAGVVVVTVLRMVRTRRWVRSGRELWNRMGGTTLGCGGKESLSS
jgi:hypothetical protein